MPYQHPECSHDEWYKHLVYAYIYLPDTISVFGLLDVGFRIVVTYGILMICSIL